MNINEELFKRYKPENKLAMIEQLSEYDLFKVTSATILRIIKEAGRGGNKQRNKFKTLYIERVGNNWNSTVDNIYNWKDNKIYISVYIQGYDTDTTCEAPIEKLLSDVNYDIELGSFEETYLHSPSRLVHARYSKYDRAKVIKEILNAYVHCKYNI